MKRLFILLAAVCMTASMMAQHEIGVIAGGINGVSYKYWFTDELAVQTDLAVGLTAAPGGMYYKGVSMGTGTLSMYDFTLNPNVAYHFQIIDDLHYFVGGGMNMGMMSEITNTNPNMIMGKFGVNGIMGICYNVGEKIALSLDFRPGYGLGFFDANTGHFSFFDWKLGFAVRYRI